MSFLKEVVLVSLLPSTYMYFPNAALKTKSVVCLSLPPLEIHRTQLIYLVLASLPFPCHARPGTAPASKHSDLPSWLHKKVLHQTMSFK